MRKIVLVLLMSVFSFVLFAQDSEAGKLKNAGNAAWKAKNYMGAFEYWKSYLSAVNFEDDACVYNLAVCASKIQAYSIAEKYFDMSIKKNYKPELAYLGKISSLEAQNKWQETYDLVLEGIQKFPNDERFKKKELLMRLKKEQGDINIQLKEEDVKISTDKTGVYLPIDTIQEMVENQLVTFYKMKPEYLSVYAGRYEYLATQKLEAGWFAADGGVLGDIEILPKGIRIVGSVVNDIISGYIANAKLISIFIFNEGEILVDAKTKFLFGKNMTMALNYYEYNDKGQVIGTNQKMFKDKSFWLCNKNGAIYLCVGNLDMKLNKKKAR